MGNKDLIAALRKKFAPTVREMCADDKFNCDTLCAGNISTSECIVFQAADAIEALEAELAAYRDLGSLYDFTALAKARDEGRIVALPFVAMVEQSLQDGNMKPERDQRFNGRYAVVYSGKGKWGCPLIDICGTTYNSDQAKEHKEKITRAEAEAALNEKAMDKCKTCSHNLDKNELGCDRLCIGVSETDGNGVVYVCEDYEAALKGGNQNAT
ncbi:MAG: hypothetical protein RR365_14180 [Bacteroides sp.]